MAHATTAPTSASKTLIPFTIKLRSLGSSVRFTALARSSGDALCNALAMPGLLPPIAASVSPLKHR
ncbi:MAG: hypothetical protein WA049_06535 [Ferribacterium limneticum]